MTAGRGPTPSRRTVFHSVVKEQKGRAEARPRYVYSYCLLPTAD